MLVILRTSRTSRPSTLRISLFSLMPLMIIVIYIMLSFLKVFGLRGSLQAMPMVGKQGIQGLEGTSGVHYSIHHHYTIIIITKHCLHGSWRQGLRVAESFWRAQNIPSDLDLFAFFAKICCFLLLRDRGSVWLFWSKT